MKTTHLLKGITRLIMLILFLICFSGMNAQVPGKHYITGQLSDKASSQPLSFATVALRRLSDSTLLTGTASDLEGRFTLQAVDKGNYELIITAIGYEGISMIINIEKDLDAGTFFLQERSISLAEVVISSERKKAESDADKTTWLINEKMHAASGSGTDLLGHIPGVMVDMMKNISLAGSQNTIILVDGRERERNFVSQLDASRIDKVEVINNPGSGYDAGVTGVINIIMKKDTKQGVSGYINAEVPSSSSEIYLFPGYSLSYGTGKINLYTSYNGELAYFNIIENTTRTFLDNEVRTKLISEQDVRQKNWSHRFHFGLDYFMNEKNQFNFYAWYNPWSREFDGSVVQTADTDGRGISLMPGTKEDTDLNSSSLYSVYYRHNFGKPGNRIEFDLSEYFYSGESTTDFSFFSGNDFIKRSGKVMPSQNTVVLRIDYSSSLGDKLRLDGGIKTRIQTMEDRQSDDFKYLEDVYASYLSVTQEISKFTIKAGLRAERSSSNPEGSNRRKIFSLLPDATVNYKLDARQNMSLAFSRTITRPDLRELNPNISYADVFSVSSGNPFLKPEFFRNLGIKYSKSSGNNFWSSQIYFRKKENAICEYATVNDDGILETGQGNLGDLRAYGVEFTGAMKLFKVLSLNTYLNLYDLQTSVNNTALKYGIVNRNRVSFESGISALANFKHDIAASVRFHYSSPGADIQTITFGDALYFLSLEKSFFKKYRIAVSSALPFSGSFTYKGYEINGADFRSRTEGNIQLSAIPLWFTFRYQFNAGRKIDRIDRVREEISNMPEKGF